MNKKKLILIPGAGCSIKFYDCIMPILSNDFDVKIITYEGNTLEECEKSLIDKLNKINESFIVLGHCLGGAIITRCIALNKIKNIKGLILCNSIANFTVFKKTFTDLNNHEHTNDYIKDGINYDKVIEAKKHLLPDEIVEKHLNISFLIDNRKILKKINMPILTLCSDKDGYFNNLQYLNTFDCCNNYSLGLISNARHLGLMTHTEEYLKKILFWYKLFINKGVEEIC